MKFYVGCYAAKGEEPKITPGVIFCNPHIRVAPLEDLAMMVTLEAENPKQAVERTIIYVEGIDESRSFVALGLHEKHMQEFTVSGGNVVFVRIMEV